MAPSAYSIPFLAPWQARRATRKYPRRYRLDLCDRNRKVIATLALNQGRDDLWTWYIDFTLSHIVGAVEGGVYILPDVAEVAALRELARWLHPEKSQIGYLPASLPPQEGGISASRQGR